MSERGDNTARCAVFVKSDRWNRCWLVLPARLELFLDYWQAPL